MRLDKFLTWESAAAGILLLVAVGGWLFILRGRNPPRASGPMSQKIYVWQRAWRPEVGQGLQRAAPLATGFVVLGAEIAWNHGPDRAPTLVRPAIDFAALRRAGRPVGIALRVGTHAAPFREGEPAGLLTQLAEELFAKAKAADVPICELQIDYDCAASKLGNYTYWVNILRKRFPDTPLIITVLPSWLRRREFDALAHAAGGYVLQVHSLTPPSDTPEPLVLCDARFAREAVETAARIGVPFSVALPTYTYVASFDGNGRLQALFAEGGAPSSAVTTSGTHLRAMHANADEMAALVQGWVRDRPAALRGIYWYRLPVEGDQLNWRWPTLAAVMAGRSPRVSLTTAVRWPEPGCLAEVELVNDGEADARMPTALRMEWSPPEIQPLAADELNGWTPDTNKSHGQRWQYVGRNDGDGAALTSRAILPAGERRVIGWMRFERSVENLRIQMENQSP